MFWVFFYSIAVGKMASLSLLAFYSFRQSKQLFLHPTLPNVLFLIILLNLDLDGSATVEISENNKQF